MLFTNFNNVTRFSSIVHICFFIIQMFWSSARREVAQVTNLPWWMKGQRKVHWDPIGQLMSVYQKRITPKWDSNRMVTICFKTWGLKKNPFKKSFFFQKKIFFSSKSTSSRPTHKAKMTILSFAHPITWLLSEILLFSGRQLRGNQISPFRHCFYRKNWLLAILQDMKE